MKMLIPIFMVLLLAAPAWGQLVNNAGTATQEDTLRVVFEMLDSLGIPQAVTSGDSMWIYVFYPGDDLAAADSVRLISETAKLTTRRLKFRTLTADYFSYTNSVANLDGIGANGTYKYTVVVGDSACCGGTGTAPMITTYHGTFQLVSTGADVSPSQAIVDAAALTYTVANEVNANMRYYEGVDGVDAEVQSEVEDGVNAATDINTLITGVNVTSVASSAIDLATDVTGVLADANVATIGVNVESATSGAIEDADVADGVKVDVNTWKTAPVLSPTTDGSIIADIDSVTAAGGDGSLDGVGLAGLNHGINWGNISNKTATNALTNTTISGLIGTVTVGAINNDVITANSIENGAIDSLTFAADAKKMIAIRADSGTAKTIGAVNSGVIDSVDFAADVRTGLLSIAPWRADTTGSWDGNLAKFGEWNAQAQAVSGAVNLDAATGSLSAAQIEDGAIDSATFAADAKTLMEITPWRADTSNATWNGVLTKFGEWNAAAQTGGGGGGGCTSCGSGSQSVTIVVIDTSGVDATLTSGLVTVQNSTQTSTMSYIPINSIGVSATHMLTASTAYKVLASSGGYIFPLYSMTTGSGASHTDTVRGYDITTTGSPIPSTQQTVLYDWAISPGGDTLYGAQITLTLAGSSNFYTSTHLVPASSIVVYAGPNLGGANDGKWSRTIFGTDSLFAPGGQKATYDVEISHPLLGKSGQKIVYKNLVIPASASSTRLRTIVSGQ